MRPILTLLLALALLPAGCARYVQKTDYRPAAEIPHDAAPAPIQFNHVELLLPVGADVGLETSGGRFCGWPRYPVSRTVLKGALDEKFLKQTFHDALEAQGYDVVGSLDIAYDLTDEINRAEYSVTAKVRDVELEMCHKEADNFAIFFTTRRGIEGELFMDVEWTLYDALRRKVAYKTRTQGYTLRRIPNQEGLALMFTEAFEMASHNLGADPAFRDLLVKGIPPQGWMPEKFPQSEEAGRYNDTVRKFDPFEEVNLSATLSREPFTKDIDRKRKAAVMVQKFGHASGFFITEEGHILTSAYMVGDALRTRIVTADGEHKLIAETLRVDKIRNVALLKLEEIPQGFEIVALPVRTDWPAVGEDVYAIGAPKSFRRFQDSVSKGIISAHRKNMRFNGAKMNFLQADADVQTGSTGGPLLDENGNVVGMTEGIYLGPEETGIGLNFFIPIDEALKALNIAPPPQ